MRWIGLVVGALAAIVVLVVIVGTLLPKGHVAARRARFAAPPERVFAIISDVGATASWRKEISRVELLPADGGRTVFREQSGHDAITYRVEALEPPRRMLVRIADTGLPFGGTWTYDLAPHDSGTELTITEDGEVYNPLFRFMSRFVFSQHATIDAYLRALGAKLGEPDPVRPEAIGAS
jgi:Polyketide cyclase / dehydrase and lipid transport